MKLAILVPTKGRPQNLRRLVKSIKATTPEPYTVYFVPDPDDLNTIRTLGNMGATVLCKMAGNYMAKVNRAVELTDEPLLFLGADDIRFHPGWLEAAKAKLEPGIGVVGTNDLHNPAVVAGRFATHMLVTREYAERGIVDGPGLMCDKYHHCFADNELVQTARARRAYAHADDSHVEHLHFLWGEAPDDQTYRDAYAPFEQDRRLFTSRKRLWRRLAMARR